MKLDKEQARDLTNAGHRADLQSSQRRTLEAILIYDRLQGLTRKQPWRDMAAYRHGRPRH